MLTYSWIVHRRYVHHTTCSLRHKSTYRSIIDIDSAGRLSTDQSIIKSAVRRTHNADEIKVVVKERTVDGGGRNTGLQSELGRDTVERACAWGRAEGHGGQVIMKQYRSVSDRVRWRK